MLSFWNSRIKIFSNKFLNLFNILILLIYNGNLNRLFFNSDVIVIHIIWRRNFWNSGKSVQNIQQRNTIQVLGTLFWMIWGKDKYLWVVCKGISTHHQNYISGILIALNMCCFNYNVWLSAPSTTTRWTIQPLFWNIFWWFPTLKDQQYFSFLNYDKWHLQWKGSNIN